MYISVKKNVSSCFFSIPALLLIPYLVTALLNGADRALVIHAPDAEACLPVVLSLQIEADFEPEAVKAQAVIARSNMYRELEEGISIFDILGEAGEKVRHTYGLWKLSQKMEEMAVYERASEETKGQVLTYQGELKLVPYHEISCGTTRDGVQVLHSEEYAYLVSVDSSQDKKAPDYLGSSYIAARQMPKKLVIKKRDSAGYVTALTADGSWLEGEAFRQGMGLTSANFTVQKIGSQYRFLCKGKGHGIGFSQYGGNVLAKEGDDWEEILENYFPKMELRDIQEME